jgi:hypothetical protein
MISSAKPILTQDLCSAKGRIINNMLYVGNVHLTENQAYTYERNPFSRQRGSYIRTITARVQVEKYLWSWVSRGLALRRTDWRYTDSRKITLSLSAQLMGHPVPRGYNMGTWASRFEESQI